MQLSLRDLQLLAEHEYSVEETRQDLNELVEYFRNMPEQRELLEVVFVQERKLPMEIGESQKIFFVDDELPCNDLPEKFQVEALGFCRNGYISYAGRLVYPVMDVHGNVMGFCGWDKFDSPKYLDSKTYGYKAKATTVFGMEKLPEYYSNNEPVYVVEGIVCCLYLRSKGFQAIAVL